MENFLYPHFTCINFKISGSSVAEFVPWKKSFSHVAERLPSLCAAVIARHKCASTITISLLPQFPESW